MAEANIFQVIGLVYLAIGLGMLVNARFYETMLKRMIEDEVALFITGLAVLVIGYFLVAYHNIWVGGSTIIITVFGWMALLKGLMLVIIPEQSINLYKYIRITKGQMSLYGIIVLILGAICLYFGYFAL